MLKGLLLLLVLANAVFFAWAQGWIDGPTGVRAHGDREPERLGQQVRPEVVQILSAVPPAKSASGPGGPMVVPATAASAPTVVAPTVSAPAPATPPAAPASVAAATPPLACLEAGPFTPVEAAAAEAAVRSALPDGSWVSVKSSRPGLWMVYLGKFKDREEQLKRQDELRTMRVEYDDLRSPAELLPGLSLGRFEERANAVNAQEKFTQRGIRNTRVIEVRPPANTVLLRVDKAPPVLAAQALGLNSSALGKGFVPCTRGGSN
ncbi:MAG: hypothetical protein AD742_17595 [Methylibium sp. NZG]|nr:MAG: hypothetical protein AD742_17595 [Methylibium sp. NZG]